MNNPVTSVYSTNLFHGTAGLLLAQSSGILLILHYRFQQVHTEFVCNLCVYDTTRNFRYKRFIVLSFLVFIIMKAVATSLTLQWDPMTAQRPVSL